MTDPAPRPDPLRAHHAVRALRIALLVVLAGVALALVATYGGRRGRPQTQITMGPAGAAPPGQGPVVDQADRFAVNGSREGRPAFSLSADSVTGFAGERKWLRSVRLTVHDEEGGDIEVTGQEGQFDASARRAVLAGGVTVRAGEGMSLSTGTLYYDSDRDMIFTADEVTFTLTSIAGEGRGLNYLVGERRLKIPDDVRLHVTRPEGAPIQMTAGDLVASLREDAAVLTGEVRMSRGDEVLRGSYVRLQFDRARNRLTGLSAFGEVVAWLPPGTSSGPGELRADSLTARLSGAAETIEEAEAFGSCRVTSGPYSARSRSARFLRSRDRLELRGDPVLLTGRERIAAQEIDLHPEARTLEARGDVRTVSLPGGRDMRGAPGFGGGGAISFQAADLRVEEAGRRAIYRGTARAWQEGNSIQADEIIVDEETRRLRADGGVMARWTDTVGAGRPVVTSITARHLVMDDATGSALFREDARLTRPDATLAADTMQASVRERPGGRDLDRVVASGSVAVRRGGTHGTSRTAEYQSAGGILVMRDEEGLAELVDSATGRAMRGRTLTFDLAGDRILTESDGGRTWITLKPEGKDAPSVEPKTHY